MRVCFLACVPSKTLGQMCRSAGLGDKPRKILDELAEIRKRRVGKPTKHLAILPHQIGLILPRGFDTVEV